MSPVVRTLVAKTSLCLRAEFLPRRPLLLFTLGWSSKMKREIVHYCFGKKTSLLRKCTKMACPIETHWCRLQSQAPATTSLKSNYNLKPSHGVKMQSELWANSTKYCLMPMELSSSCHDIYLNEAFQHVHSNSSPDRNETFLWGKLSQGCNQSFPKKKECTMSTHLWWSHSAIWWS